MWLVCSAQLIHYRNDHIWYYDIYNTKSKWVSVVLDIEEWFYFVVQAYGVVTGCYLYD